MKEVVIDGGIPQITSCADRAFENCGFEGTLDLRSWVKLSDSWGTMFTNNTLLECVRFPASFASMGATCFDGSSCTRVTFGDENNPSKISSINATTFQDCSDDMIVVFYLEEGKDIPSGSPWGNENITIRVASSSSVPVIG